MTAEVVVQRERVIASDQQASQDTYNNSSSTGRQSVVFRTGINFSHFMSAAVEESGRAALAATEPGLRNRDMRTAYALFSASHVCFLPDIEHMITLLIYFAFSIFAPGA
jgi:hypothetical protein